MVTRRRFVKNATAAPALALAPGLFLLPGSADAILPGIVARFLFGAFIRRSAARSVAGAVARQSATQTARNAGRNAVVHSSTRAAGSASVAGASFKGLSLSGVSASLLSVSFSPRIHAISRAYGANVVWVKDADHVNSFGYDIENSSETPEVGSVGIFVEEVDTGKIVNQLPVVPINVRAGRAFTYSFEPQRLDYEGVVRLIAESSSSKLVAPPSGNIIVASADEVYTRGR